MISGLQLIEREISQSISEELNKIGLLYRIFTRTKDLKSISEKIERKSKEGTPYTVGGRLIQDLIGVRVVTYFKEDVEIVYSLLKKKFEYIDEQIDNHDLTVFKPKRTNIICSFRKLHDLYFNEVKNSSEIYSLIDNTFELQLRTVLSEGWHEIDHSLRYKCKSDWEGYYENERMLNGIYASLETNDMALKNLFNELAYKHYQNKNWEGLIRNKFRLQFQPIPLNEEIIEILNENETISKELLKVDRELVLLKISALDFSIPITFNNIIFLVNELIIKNDILFRITPEIIIQEISR